MESFNGFMDSIFYTSDLEPVNSPDDLKEGKMESFHSSICLKFQLAMQKSSAYAIMCFISN
jgi:hypothetical protein